MDIDHYIDLLVKKGSPDQCTLFTDSFARFLQVVLGFIGLFVLYLKRRIEHPKRPITIWVFDVCKQCTGAFYVHCLNILQSIILVSHSTGYDDECGIYFSTFLLDATFGLFVVIQLLRVLKYTASDYQWTTLSESGHYGNPPQLKYWWQQCFAYLTILTLMKFLNAIILWYFYDTIAFYSTALFKDTFAGHRHAELILVMIVTPACMNAVQFWIVDGYLKDRGASYKHYAHLTDQEDLEKQHVLPFKCCLPSHDEPKYKTTTGS